MRRMQLAALAALPILAMGCKDTTGITIETLAGTWNATQFQFTNTADPTQTVDVIALGVTFTIVVSANGDYAATMQEPGELPEVEEGTVSIVGDVITVSESGQGSPTPFSAVRSGNTLTLTNTDEEYDFDEDGGEEPASLRIVLRKG